MKKVIKVMKIVLGAFMMAFAYKTVFDSAGMVTGGFSGIGIMVRKLFNVPMWVTNTVLNVPLFIVAYRVKGRDFVKSTFLGTFMLTFFIGVLPEIDFGREDLLLPAIYGGVICGTGIALVITSGAATGGTDMLASVINRFLPHYGIARIMQMLDAAIVLASVAVFGLYRSMYGIIAIYVTTYVCDRLVDGLKFAKCLVIISDKADVIAKSIMQHLQRGVTGLEGVGMYSDNKKTVLYCIVSRKESVLLKELVEELDNRAFVIVSDVREVMGEGFRQN